jgi:replicative superfamily II helicase
LHLVFTSLNSLCFDYVILTGKTAIFEMAMARFFTVDLQNNRQVRALCRQPQISRHRKIVYMAPSKALCEERFNDWSMRLRSLNLGIQVSLITGDGDPGDAFRDLSASHLVVTTPEKFDSLSRRWPETFYLFASIKLYLVDEAHMVADEGRGSCLESVLCRTRTIQRAASQVQVTSQELATSR